MKGRWINEGKKEQEYKRRNGRYDRAEKRGEIERKSKRGILTGGIKWKKKVGEKWRVKKKRKGRGRQENKKKWKKRRRVLKENKWIVYF